jgi:hypothetical protein
VRDQIGQLCPIGIPGTVLRVGWLFLMLRECKELMKIVAPGKPMAESILPFVRGAACGTSRKFKTHRGVQDDALTESKGAAASGRNITEMNRRCLVQFDTRMLGPYLAAIHRILIPAVEGVDNKHFNSPPPSGGLWVLIPRRGRKTSEHSCYTPRSCVQGQCGGAGTQLPQA